MFRWIAMWMSSERGQDLIEYSLLAGVIAAAMIVVSMAVLTGSIQEMSAGIAACIDWSGPVC